MCGRCRVSPRCAGPQSRAAGAATLNYGLFLNTVIEFLIVALAVFLLIRLLNRLYQAPPATPTTKTCPYCIAVIPLAASRCPQCTSDLRAARDGRRASVAPSSQTRSRLTGASQASGR